MKVLVKGAGVAGLTVAHELVRRGAQVEIVERSAGVKGGASWLAGGMLAPFCEGESAPDEVVRMGGEAADWWSATLPGHVVRKGTLVVAPPRDSAELTRFAQRTRGHEWVDGDAIASLEPAFAGRFRKGLFFAEEAHLDPRAALTALRDGLAREGVDIRFGASEDGSESGYDRIVDCSGAAAIGTMAGLRGVRGEMLYLESSEVSLSRTIRLLHPRHPLYVVPRGQGRFMVGATMIESDDAGPVSARSLMELLNAAYALHPAFGEARVVETGAGVRPAFADNLPRVIEDGRTIHINGLYRHGFLLAPAMARRAADLVMAATPAMADQE